MFAVATMVAAVVRKLFASRARMRRAARGRSSECRPAEPQQPGGLIGSTVA